VKRSEQGFTLIELLIVISIVGMIALAFTEASVIGWRTTSATTTTFASSHDAQTTSTFWTQDVQSSAVVDTTASDTRCLLTGDTLIVRFTGTTTDASSVATSRVQAYVQRVAGTETQLIRRGCAGPVGGTLSSTGDIITVHGLGNPAVTPAPQTPVVTCLPSCALPRSVTLTVVDQSGYTFALTARRRSL
jgi:prepilin-type N-terminal cleavage/methylation domain-containing protein